MFHSKNVTLYRNQNNTHTHNIEASAPTAPWYYDKNYNYPSEVIMKVHKVLENTWHKLPLVWQKYYLDTYYYKYENNNLE